MDKTTLKEIALEQRSVFLNRSEGVPRAALDRVGSLLKLPHAVVVSGIRRCGKSTFLKQIASRYLEQSFFYFNFEDERLLGFEPGDFSLLHEVLIGSYGEQKVFLLDEVQNAPAWEAFVRRMSDAGFKFVLTGSNASLLSGELATKLTGRHAEIALFPFSFDEFLRFRNIEKTDDLFLTPSGRAKLDQQFGHYRSQGGFPDRLEHDSPEILSRLYEDIVYRDVAVRHEIKNTRALRELSLYYMSNLATLCSYNRLKSSLGLGSTTTVASYTDHLEQAYLLSTVNVFDSSIKRRAIAPKKVYATDTGLANAVSLSFSKNIGALTENIVFTELYRRQRRPFYYKTASGKEVDFACVKGLELRELIQVSHDISAPSTRARELDSLLEAISESGLETGLLLTQDRSEEITDQGRTVLVRPVTHWLLER